jgi:hypothetical protein
VSRSALALERLLRAIRLATFELIRAIAILRDCSERAAV